MKSNTEHQVTITCTGCQSSYTVPLKNNETDHAITCSSCGKNLKIIRCAQCKSHYSITYGTLQQQKYKYTCQNCKNTFIVNFTDRPQTVKANEIIQRKHNTNTKAQEDHSAIHQKKPERPDERIKEKKTAPYKKANPHTSDNSISQLNPEALLRACGDAFSLSKIITGAGAGALLLGLIFIYNTIIPNFRESSLLQSIIFSTVLGLMLFIYTLSAALISRKTMHKILFNNNTSFSAQIAFTAKTSARLLFISVILLLLINGLLLIFSNIPFLGPVAFGLMFFPVYLASAMLIAFLFIGFWFYPPLLAHKTYGSPKTRSGLFYFIKKHNFSLVYIVPILLITIILSFGIIYLLHFSAFKLTAFTASLFSGQEAEQIFSSIPASVTRLTSPILFGTDLSIFKGLYETISLSVKAGGLFMGMVLFFITALLSGIAVSLVSTLSTHVYLFLETDNSNSDTDLLRILAILVLILVALVLLQKII